MIAVITIVGSTSFDPKPQFGFGGGLYRSKEECQGALLQRQTTEVSLIQNMLGEYVLFGQARGYVWTEGCIFIPR
jgi:hypothetical protein